METNQRQWNLYVCIYVIHVDESITSNSDWRDLNSPRDHCDPGPDVLFCSLTAIKNVTSNKGVTFNLPKVFWLKRRFWFGLKYATSGQKNAYFSPLNMLKTGQTFSGGLLLLVTENGLGATTWTLHLATNDSTCLIMHHDSPCLIIDRTDGQVLNLLVSSNIRLRSNCNAPWPSLNVWHITQKPHGYWDGSACRLAGINWGDLTLALCEFTSQIHPRWNLQLPYFWSQDWSYPGSLRPWNVPLPK